MFFFFASYSHSTLRHLGVHNNKNTFLSDGGRVCVCPHGRRRRRGV